MRGQKQTAQKQTAPPHSYSNIPPEWSLLGPCSSWLGLCATRPSGTLKTSEPKEDMYVWRNCLWGNNGNCSVVHVPFRECSPPLISITRPFVRRPANHALVQPTPWCDKMAMVPLLDYCTFQFLDNCGLDQHRSKTYSLFNTAYSEP